MPKYYYICLFLILFLIWKEGHGHKILIFSPTNSKSHLISNGRISDTLAKNGHNVTLLEAEFRVLSKDVKSAKIAQRLILSGFNSSVFDAAQASLISTTFDPPSGILDQLSFPKEFFDAFNIQCDKMWEMHREKLLKLAEEKFDIVMSEQLNLCGVGLQAALKIKTHIWISSCPLDDHMGYILGVPTPLSYVPAVGEISVSDQMSLYERLRNILEFWKNIRSYFYGMYETDKIYQKYFGTSFPSVIELARKSALTFVLADEFLDFPRPILHTTIFVGGLGLDDSTEKPVLPNDYDVEMKKGRKGVIFFSFGTNVDTTDLPKAFKKYFFAAVKHFQDYHFIVKFDSNDKDAKMEAENIPNCKLVNWAPQPAILAHDHLKLFITHGGYNSLLESVNYAKPLLLLPIFGDQWRNAMLAQRNGFGKVFEKRNLLTSSTEFINVLNEILTNSSYEKQSKRMQKLVKTKPMNATQRLLSYIQFIGDNNGILPELSIVGSHLNWMVYFNIDVILVVFMVAVIFPLIILAATIYFFRKYWNKPKENRQKRGSSIGDKRKAGKRY